MKITTSELTDAQTRLRRYQSDYLGLAELAMILNRDRSSVCRSQRNGHLPAPTARMSRGPLWTREQITKLLATTMPNEAKP